MCFGRLSVKVSIKSTSGLLRALLKFPKSSFNRGCRIYQCSAALLPNVLYHVPCNELYLFVHRDLLWVLVSSLDLLDLYTVYNTNRLYVCGRGHEK